MRMEGAGVRGRGASPDSQALHAGIRRPQAPSPPPPPEPSLARGEPPARSVRWGSQRSAKPCARGAALPDGLEEWGFASQALRAGSRLCLFIRDDIPRQPSLTRGEPSPRGAFQPFAGGPWARPQHRGERGTGQPQLGGPSPGAAGGEPAHLRLLDPVRPLATDALPILMPALSVNQRCWPPGITPSRPRTTPGTLDPCGRHLPAAPRHLLHAPTADSSSAWRRCAPRRSAPQKVPPGRKP